MQQQPAACHAVLAKSLQLLNSCVHLTCLQGMTVGVMGSALLGKCVKEGLARAGPSRGQQLAALDVIPTKFHTQLEGVVDYPWTLASGPDAV